MTDIEITKECEILRNVGQYLLNLAPTKNPLDIASTLGVTIRCVDLKDTAGFVDKGELFTDTTIYLNERLDNYSKKIICAHELGHIFSNDDLEQPSFFDSSIDSENEFFANYMVKCLMPQVFILAKLEQYKSIKDFNNYVTSCVHYKE